MPARWCCIPTARWRGRTTRAPMAGQRESSLLAAVLRVGDVLHPGHVLALECLLHRDVRHARGWAGTVPVLLVRRDPDRVAGANFTDRTAPGLHAAGSGEHVKRLP